MGYYTRYDLDATGKGPVLEQFQADVEAGLEIGGYVNVRYLINGGCDEMKWYSYDDDMKAMSKDYPNVLFTLRGEGEESGDLWKAYYRNGKSVQVKARFVFDTPDLDRVIPFDPALEPSEEAIALKQRELAAKAELERTKKAQVAELQQRIAIAEAAKNKALRELAAL